MAKRNMKVFGGLVAIAIFVLMVFYIPKILENEVPLVCIEDGACQHEEYLSDVINLIPLIIVIGFLFGLAVSYFYFEKKIEVPAPSPNRADALTSLLQTSERKVVAKIMEKGGEALQSEVSRVEGIGKVKAHRVIERLVKRGVLEKEQLGKTNVLRLRKDIYKALTS